MTTNNRFWNKVDTSAGPDGCWYWVGYTNGAGYGIVYRNSKRFRAHRVSYEETYGPIAEGLEIDHICHNESNCNANNECLHRSCVNPAHLEAVSHKTNVLRGKSPYAEKARQTYCKRGHEFTAENTYYHGGNRSCRECHRLEMLVASRKAQGMEHIPLDVRVSKNSCKYGHPLKGDNLIGYTNPKTGKKARHCRTCRQNRARRQCEARGAVYVARGEAKPYCKNGHEMTSDNTYTQTRGTKVSRSCKTCRSEASRRQAEKAKQAKSE